MHRALVYLLWTQLRNRLRTLGQRPIRLLVTILILGVFLGSALLGGTHTDMEVGARAAVLSSLLGLYLLLAVFGGLGEPGLGFTASDLDLVFPAPFRRRDVLLYHLSRGYLQVLFLGLVYAVFLGAARLPNPGLAYLGIVLCLVACTHLQTAATLFTSRLGDRVFGRLRFATRAVLLGALGVAAVLAILGAAGAGDVTGWLRGFFALPAVRVLLYPAVAATQLALAPDAAAVVGPALGLVAYVIGSFAVVLLFRIDFMESAYQATRTRAQRMAGGATGRREARTSTRAPRLLFGGAGAVAWLNVLTLRRRLRMIVGALVMLTVLLLVSGVRRSAGGGGRFPPVLGMLAFFPMILNLPLGFRGQREHLAFLKTLPIAPMRLAIAQVIVPVAVVLVLQIAIVAVYVAAGTLDPSWMGLALAVFPVLDVGVIALADLFQLGVDRRQLGFLTVTWQMIALGVSVVPAVLAGIGTLRWTGNSGAAVAAAVGVHAGVDVVILWLLGVRFRVWEASATEG